MIVSFNCWCAVLLQLTCVLFSWWQQENACTRCVTSPRRRTWMERRRSASPSSLSPCAVSRASVSTRVPSTPPSTACLPMTSPRRRWCASAPSVCSPSSHGSVLTSPTTSTLRTSASACRAPFGGDPRTTVAATARTQFSLTSSKRDNYTTILLWNFIYQYPT